MPGVNRGRIGVRLGEVGARLGVGLRRGWGEAPKKARESQFGMVILKTGGPDETRTRDLCRDRAAL